MTDRLPALRKLQAGTVSRLAKKRWIKDGMRVTVEAFDLRDRTPPETYVSFFMCEGFSSQELQYSAVRCHEERITLKKNDLMFLLDLKEAIEEVNDEVEIIEFIPKGMPHCGLIYQVKEQSLIQEAKAVLCLLAQVFPTKPFLTPQITQA